jgi:hypothetical protein
MLRSGFGMTNDYVHLFLVASGENDRMASSCPGLIGFGGLMSGNGQTRAVNLARG